MKQVIWIVTLFLFGCSTAPREQTLFEYAQGLNHPSAIAGPDIRSSGELLEIMHNEFWFVNRYDRQIKAFEKGFKAYHQGSDLKSVEKAAIDDCEAHNGQGKCYIYLRNGRNVRLAERKKWLARNPSELALISKEKAEEKERLDRLAKTNSTTANLSTAKKEPNYEAAGQLFGIANQALQSTMPKTSNTINCTTTSGGYLTGTLITNCR